jgi:hypothetical protein
MSDDQDADVKTTPAAEHAANAQNGESATHQVEPEDHARQELEDALAEDKIDSPTNGHAQETSDSSTAGEGCSSLAVN